MKIQGKSSLRAAVAAAALCVGTLGAATIYVDADKGDDGNSGETELLAKKTLQAAVDAAQTDDTVIALPGNYDKGFAVEGNYTNRVLITKRITLKSKEKWGAHIVGAHDTVSGNAVPWGPTAIRCVGIKNTNNVRIEGFTIRGGACHENLDGINGSGGGVMQLGGVSSYYVVDCVISNCVATRGHPLPHDRERLQRQRRRGARVKLLQLHHGAQQMPVRHDAGRPVRELHAGRYGLLNFLPERIRQFASDVLRDRPARQW